jgi:hypothetical protein
LIVDPALSAADRAQLAGWTAALRAAPGRVPEGLAPVQVRLIRAVCRATLPDAGEVFVKWMAFPRRRDRFRYWLRRLPACHEARMLIHARRRHIPCPRVLWAAGERTVLGAPRFSLLVTAALPAAATVPPGLAACARLAASLAAARIYHGDLTRANFLSLLAGGEAVVDLQSARARRRPLSVWERRAMAAKLLSEAWPELESPVAVVDAGLIDAAALPAACRRARRLRLALAGRRIARCLRESTEFAVQRSLRGKLVQRRRLPPGGTWLAGGRELVRWWIGDRTREVLHADAPVLAALFVKSWWLPGEHSVYIPEPNGVARVHLLTPRLLEGFAQYRQMKRGGEHGDEFDTQAPLPWSGSRKGN